MKRELKSLLKEAAKSLDFAQVLLEKRDFYQSVFRSSYAMACAAEAALLTKNLKSSGHEEMISAFGRHFGKARIVSKGMSKSLRDASRKWREISMESFLGKLDDGYRRWPPDPPWVDANYAYQLKAEAQKFVKEIRMYLRTQGYNL